MMIERTVNNRMNRTETMVLHKEQNSSSAGYLSRSTSTLEYGQMKPSALQELSGNACHGGKGKSMKPTNEYRKERVTINIVRANLFGTLILIPIAVMYGLAYYWKWNNGFSLEVVRIFVSDVTPKAIAIGTATFFLVFVLGSLVHELIHGVTWARYAKKGFKSIQFGMLWEMFTPYCHCNEPLLKKHYILGAVMPAIILGLIPAVISIILGNSKLLLFGIIFTMTACGDFLVICKLGKENEDSLVQDHPSELGFYIYRKVTS